MLNKNKFNTYLYITTFFAINQLAYSSDIQNIDSIKSLKNTPSEINQSTSVLLQPSRLLCDVSQLQIPSVLSHLTKIDKKLIKMQYEYIKRNKDFDTLLIMNAKGKTQCVAISLLAHIFETFLSQSSSSESKTGSVSPNNNISLGKVINTSLGISYGTIPSVTIASEKQLLMSISYLLPLETMRILSPSKSIATSVIYLTQNIATGCLTKKKVDVSNPGVDQKELYNLKYDAFSNTNSLKECLSKIFGNTTLKRSPKAEFAMNVSSSDTLSKIILKNIKIEDKFTNRKIKSIFKDALLNTTSEIAGLLLDKNIENTIEGMTNSDDKDPEIEGINSNQMIIDLTEPINNKEIEEPFKFEDIIQKLTSYKPDKNLIIISLNATTSPLSKNSSDVDLSLSPLITKHSNHTKTILLPYQISIPDFMYDKEMNQENSSKLHDTLKEYIMSEKNAGLKNTTEKLLELLSKKIK